LVVRAIPVASFALAVIGSGCIHKVIAAADQAWFIQSWENSIVTFQHERNTYSAKCKASRLLKR
jgi:hypothetical protein